MFSTLFNKHKNGSKLDGRSRPDKGLYSKVISLCKNVFCKSEYDKRTEKEIRTEIYAFRCVATFLCKEIAIANKKNTQSLSESFCNVLENININALNGLMISKTLFRSLAEMNSISCLSAIDREYYHPSFESHEAYASSPYVFKSFTSLPEYVFSGDLLKVFVGNPDSGHCQKIIIFQRVFLEIFMESSILVQEYREAGTINNPLFERLVQNGKELEYLSNISISEQDFLNFEMEREKSLIGISYEGVQRLMIPYSPSIEALSESETAPEALNNMVLQQSENSLNSKRNIESTEKRLDVEVVELPNVELLDESEESIEDANADVIQFLSKLEEDHHRRDIYLAIIAYEFVRGGNALTFRAFWEWLITYLADNPLQTRNVDGHEVKLFLSGGVIRHLGLLNSSTKDSQVQKSTFKTMYFKKIKPIVPKIKGFCIEKNIENIPIIP